MSHANDLQAFAAAQRYREEQQQGGAQMMETWGEPEGEGLSEERLEEIEARVRAAGPADDEWEVMGNTVTFQPGYFIALPGDIPKADFIAHSRRDVEDLLAEVRRFRLKPERL